MSDPRPMLDDDGVPLSDEIRERLRAESKECREAYEQTLRNLVIRDPARGRYP